MSDQIAGNSLIFAHLTIITQEDQVFDSSKTSGKPAVIQLGNGSISDAMESALIGSKVGETKRFEVDAANGFGEVQPDLVQFMDMHQFATDIELKEGTVVQFEQMHGGSVPGIIREVQGHSVKVDFNHPLAGQPVTFEIEILSLEHPPEDLAKSAESTTTSEQA